MKHSSSRQIFAQTFVGTKCFIEALLRGKKWEKYAL
jgi:hypothetical protein